MKCSTICAFSFMVFYALKILKTLMVMLPLKLRSFSLKLRSLSPKFMFLQAVVPIQRSMMTILRERLKVRVLSSYQQDLRSLSEEFEDFFDNSINEVNAANTPVPAIGQISTNSTNTFSAAGPSNTTVLLTLRESSYVDPFQYPDDLNMLALEDITYSDDDEDVGAEDDFSNFETTITVSPIPTTRVHKDHHVTQIIGDLSLAT
nr:hypothetical protein [Tanacetum cinerariifolium]